MKFLSQKPLLLPQRARPFSTDRPGLPSMGIEWKGKFRTATSAGLRVFQRIKGLGFTANMDDFEKRKLGIFN